MGANRIRFEPAGWRQSRLLLQSCLEVLIHVAAQLAPLNAKVHDNSKEWVFGLTDMEVEILVAVFGFTVSNRLR
jgi:hypothetical protein